MKLKEALKNKTFWLKASITVLFVFIASEIILRIFGYTGIVSIDALNIIAASSKRFLLLLDNLLLFTIVIFIPVIFASYLRKKVPIEHYKYSIKGKGPLYHSTITMKAPTKVLKYYAEGKGLIFGSIIVTIYNAIDFLLIKKIVPECTYYCGFENAFALAFGMVYLSIGIFLIKKKSSTKIN